MSTQLHHPVLDYEAKDSHISSFIKIKVQLQKLDDVKVKILLLFMLNCVNF